MCDGLAWTGVEGRVGSIFRRHPGHFLVALGGTARLSWGGEGRDEGVVVSGGERSEVE